MVDMRAHNSGLNPQQRTAAALLIAALQEAVQETDEAKALWDEKRTQRDILIRESLEFIPKLRMVKITGLSRERLYRIENSPTERKA